MQTQNVDVDLLWPERTTGVESVSRPNAATWISREPRFNFADNQRLMISSKSKSLAGGASPTRPFVERLGFFARYRPRRTVSVSFSFLLLSSWLPLRCFPP